MKVFMIKDTTGRGIAAQKVGVNSLLDFVDGCDEEDRGKVDQFSEHAAIGDAIHLESEQCLITRVQDRDDSAMDFLRNSTMNKGVGLLKYKFENNAYEIKYADGEYEVVIANRVYKSANPFHAAAELLDYVLAR